MTQMGLDYRKYLLDKEIRPGELAVKEKEAGIKQQEADTHAYTASFEPLRVEISGKSADAAMVRANAAATDAATKQREADIKERLSHAEEQLMHARQFSEYVKWMPSITSEALSVQDMIDSDGNYRFTEDEVMIVALLGKAGDMAETVFDNGVKAVMGSGYTASTDSKGNKYITAFDSNTGETTTYKRQGDKVVKIRGYGEKSSQ